MIIPVILGLVLLALMGLLRSVLAPILLVSTVLVTYVASLGWRGGCLVVRTVLVPAIVLTLGERFWWPRKVDPVTPSAAP